MLQSPLSSLSTEQALILEVVAGPAFPPLRVSREKPFVIGRAMECDACLPDSTVSRRHASLVFRAGRWFLTDLGSTHGTFINGNRLVADAATPLAEIDQIRIGPWTLRARTNNDLPKITASTVDSSPDQHVERLPARSVPSLAQHRLGILIDCSAAIHAAADETTMAGAVLDAAIAGTGFHRAALLRPIDDERVTVVGYRSLDGSISVPEFSRSLINEASSGELARLASGISSRFGESIVQLGIHSAMCAPVFVGSAIEAYLYLDARGRESFVEPDAPGFGQALSRICGLALSNLHRHDLEQRQKRIEADLAAAREAQQLIVPKADGRVNDLVYALRMHPGRHVAGDLFDVVDLPGDRVAVVIGDVAGAGVGAAILMASIQAHLHASLREHGEPAAAVRDVNLYISHRIAMDKFSSLWVGVIDLANHEIRYVDAGHGHWLLAPRDGSLYPTPRPGGMPVGIDAGFVYEAATLAFKPGDRLILYSDGVVEQPNLAGERFGAARVLNALASAASPSDDVAALFHAVTQFSGDGMIADDTTVASVQSVRAQA